MVIEYITKNIITKNIILEEKINNEDYRIITTKDDILLLQKKIDEYWVFVQKSKHYKVLLKTIKSFKQKKDEPVKQSWAKNPWIIKKY